MCRAVNNQTHALQNHKPDDLTSELAEDSELVCGVDSSQLRFVKLTSNSTVWSSYCDH